MQALRLIPVVVWVMASASGEDARNQLQNSSFDEDWLVSKVLAERRWGLTARAEAGYGESDGLIDHWEVPCAWRDGAVAHSGGYSVKLDAGKKLVQAVRVAMRAPKGGNPASGNTNFQPWEPADLAKLEPRQVRGGAWVRGRDVPDGNARLIVRAGAKAAERPVPGITNEWQLVEVVSPEPWPAATEMALSIELAAGELWVDDAFLDEVPLGRNRATNGDFEALDPNGWPEGYGQPEPFWWFRFDYYSWTGWSHDGGYGCQLADRIDLVPGYRWRGHAAVDSLISHSGRNSLRFVAYPGDNFGVLGPPVDIDGSKPFEIGAWVKADRIHQVELMAVNPATNRYILMDSDDFAALEGVGVSAGSKGQGSYDWTYLRKLIVPKEPVQRIRPMMAVRGFDGRIIEKNHVGTVWFDDIEVIQRGETGSPLPPAPRPADAQIRHLDLGDRLWGRNRVRLDLKGSKGLPVTVELTVTAPNGQKQEQKVSCEMQGTVRAVGFTYEIADLCRNGTEQYQLELSLTEGGTRRTTRLAFGTPSSLLSTRLSHYYLFPGEKLVVAANLNVSRQSLGDLSRAVLQIADPQGKVVSETALEQPGERLPLLAAESTAIPYLDVRQCLTLVPDLRACTVRPWREATRDYTPTLRLIDKAGKELASARGVPFGSITRFDPTELPMVEQGKKGHYVQWEPKGAITVNDEHFLLVDGKPFFPVYFGEYGDTFRAEEGINIDRNQVLSLGINPLVLSPEEKAKYGMAANFGTGEWDLNGLMDLKPADVRAAADRLRADRPGKLVVSGYDMVSHPGSRRADVAAYVFPAYDVVGMEASFASYAPNLRVDYFPAMGAKKSAILVGFEHYYFVPYEELRYRAYLSVMRGAAGLGLIPSRMMMPRPETNNYLRGMNAECRSLAPVFAAPAPDTPTASSVPNLFTWEKILNGRRYLFVVRGEPFLTRGLFQWTGRKSPGGQRSHSEPRDAGLAQHWVENTKPCDVRKGDTLMQELFIEGAAPRMIAVQFRTRTAVDHTWEHRAYWGKADPGRFRQDAEYPADRKPPQPWPAWMVVENPPQPINAASERGAYYFEVLGGAACKAVDGQPSLRPMGDVPTPGTWHTLRIPAAQLGLEGQRLDGIAFSVDGGQVSWGKTSILSAAGEETALIDGSLDGLAVDPGSWSVKFTVPNAKSIQVRTLFENVDVRVEGNSFEDSFPVPYRARVYEITAR